MKQTDIVFFIRGFSIKRKGKNNKIMKINPFKLGMEWE